MHVSLRDRTGHGGEEIEAAAKAYVEGRDEKRTFPEYHLFHWTAEHGNDGSRARFYPLLKKLALVEHRKLDDYRIYVQLRDGKRDIDLCELLVKVSKVLLQGTSSKDRRSFHGSATHSPRISRPFLVGPLLH